MIAKGRVGGGFRGALEYDLQEGKSELLETNLAGETPRAMAQEFGEVRQLRPNLGKAVFHASVSAALGEHLTNAQWVAIAHRALDGLGLTDNQYVITRHTDTEHEHIHILANRITFGGEVVNDWQFKRRLEPLMREIERDYGLRAVAPSQEAARKAPTQGEIEYALRTGEPSLKHQLQDLCDAAMQDCRNLSTYIQRLEAVGVDVIPTVQLNGAKVSGLMYRLNEGLMKGSDLGKAYSPVGLAKKGVTYAQDRDFATVERCREREAHRAYEYATGEGPAYEGAERRGVSGPAGAVGPSDGRVDGRDARDLSAVTTREYGAGAGVRSAEPSLAPNVGTESGRTTGSRPAVDESDRLVDSKLRADLAPSGVATGVETLRADGGDRGLGRAAHDRIVALALGQASDVYPALQTVRDRTTQSVQRQLQAFGVDRVDIGIRDGREGKMMNRLWTPDEVLKHTAWLKRMNAQGNDIYVKPVGEHGLVLVDDLQPEAIDRLKGHGFNPAIVTETSPGNLQAWLKLSQDPIEARDRTIVAREIARDFGGDLNSADAQHYGRLAGFTNQKPERQQGNGLPPFVLLREWGGQVMTKAHDLLEKVDRFLDQQAVQKAQKDRLTAIHIEEVQKPAPRGRKTPLEPVAEYRRQAQVLATQYGPAPDWSKLDWMIAKSMVASGQYDADAVERAILGGSPNIRTRKPGHLADYARRTATKAWQDPYTQTQREARMRAQQQEQADRDRGYSR